MTLWYLNIESMFNDSRMILRRKNIGPNSEFCWFRFSECCQLTNKSHVKMELVTKLIESNISLVYEWHIWLLRLTQNWRTLFMKHFITIEDVTKSHNSQNSELAMLNSIRAHIMAATQMWFVCLWVWFFLYDLLSFKRKTNDVSVESFLF